MFLNKLNLMKPLLIFTLTVLSQLTLAQDLDAFPQVSKWNKNQTTQNILDSLEIGALKNTRVYFENLDSTALSDIKLIQYELLKIKDATKRGTSLVVTEEYNIYKTVYCNNTGEIFEVSFIYAKGLYECVVLFFSYKTRYTLDLERQSRIDKTKLPPPPTGWNG